MRLVADAPFQIWSLSLRQLIFLSRACKLHALLQGTPRAMAPTTRVIAVVLARLFDLENPAPTGQNKHHDEQRLKL
jgi:hypothetical protein